MTHSISFRFHAWDKATCSESIGHQTCSTPNRCRRFGSNTSCSFSDRSRAFIPLGGIWGRAEGIFGMNNAFDGGHCSAVFDPDYKYFGIGYWPSMSSATYLYIKVWGLGIDSIRYWKLKKIFVFFIDFASCSWRRQRTFPHFVFIIGWSREKVSDLYGIAL